MGDGGGPVVIGVGASVDAVAAAAVAFVLFRVFSVSCFRELFTFFLFLCQLHSSTTGSDIENDVPSKFEPSNRVPLYSPSNMLIVVIRFYCIVFLIYLFE